MRNVEQRWWKRLVLPLLAVPLAVSGGCQPSFYYNCHDSGEIDANKQQAIAAVGLEFTRAILTGETDAVYSLFTEAAKANTSRDQLAGVMQTFRSGGPFDHFQVERIMTVTGWGDMSRSNGIVVCSKDASHPENGVTLAIQKIPEQAYLLVSAKGSQETWITAVWLVPGSGKWQVQAAHTTIKTVLGKSAEEYLAMARAEKNRGHSLNAGLLYSGAASIAAKAPFYHTGMEDLIQKESQAVTAPQEFRGQSPFSLAGDGETFSIIRVFTVPLDGKIYLRIAHEVDPWKNTAEIESKNHRLMKTFARRFPEYHDLFGGLIVEATARGGNTGWRTIEENAAILRSPSPAAHK